MQLTQVLQKCVVIYLTSLKIEDLVSEVTKIPLKTTNILDDFKGMITPMVPKNLPQD